MSVFMYLIYKIADGCCIESEIQFAYDYGAITEEERRKLFNLNSNLYFGYYKRETLREKLNDLLVSEEFDDETAFREREWV